MTTTHPTPSRFTTSLPSPLGPLTLVATDAALVSVEFDGRGPLCGAVPRRTPLLAQACAEVAAYFGGRLQVFDLPLAPAGTGFQQEVWAALRSIPCGEVRSYAEIAHQIGRPAAVRAVGAANGRNPISIVVPCHRVVGSDGSLTGYGGGLDRKRWLLAHERGGHALS